MTRAKRDGNNRDLCAAIRVKRKLFKLRAFTVDLQAPISLSLSSFAFFFSLPPFFSFPIDSHPRYTFSLSALFIVSVSFQASRTVYKVEALNWKPRLCRRYCGFFFSPFRFHPVCCLSLLFYPSPSPLPFLSPQRVERRRYSCTAVAKARLDVARTGRRYSWHWVQIYWTCCSWSNRTSTGHNWIYNRERLLLNSVPRRDIISLFLGTYEDTPENRYRKYLA